MKEYSREETDGNDVIFRTEIKNNSSTLHSTSTF